jgi:hypothetical protein
MWAIYDIHIVLFSIILVHELQEIFSLLFFYMWFQKLPTYKYICSFNLCVLEHEY